MSAVFKLDNCLLWCNPDSYCTIPRYFVLVVLSLILLAVDRHLSKLNGFVTSSGLLRSASMESSPIKTVSVKLEIAKCLFLFALLTQLGCITSIEGRNDWVWKLMVISLSVFKRCNDIFSGWHLSGILGCHQSQMVDTSKIRWWDWSRESTNYDQ